MKTTSLTAIFIIACSVMMSGTLAENNFLETVAGGRELTSFPNTNTTCSSNSVCTAIMTNSCCAKLTAN